MIEDIMNSNKPAIKAIFKFGVEPREKCFVKYNSEESHEEGDQLKEVGKNMYMYIPEPYKYRKSKEICIVTELEKNRILKGADLIVGYCAKSGKNFESFEDKLKYAASLLPKVFCEGTKYSK